jgi:intracellular sulfur oxidation DsrE/DsrF family protein
MVVPWYAVASFQIQSQNEVHMSKQCPPPPDRRSFLTRLNTGFASFAAMTGLAMAQKKPTAGANWEPARHEKDDWMDELSSKHRVVFDTTTPEGFGDALAFASNFMHVNRSEYGLQSGDVAVVIVARHRSAPFGYNDAMWAKYGMALAARSKVDDPKTKLPPKMNLYNVAGYGELLRNRGTTLDSLFKQGVQLAVCSLSTHGYAGVIAQAVGGNAEAIFSELIANVMSNVRMVPAGVVAVTRAQERGYSLVTS